MTGHEPVREAVEATMTAYLSHEEEADELLEDITLLEYIEETAYRLNDALKLLQEGTPIQDVHNARVDKVRKYQSDLQGLLDRFHRVDDPDKHWVPYGAGGL